MNSIYSDDQRQSLIDSMTNPQSNAAKFLEQGGETGLSPDITMDILNKYATYGANTGIGNIGGSRLVEALNEEYRKKVDAPLQQEPKEAFYGGLVEALKALGTGAVNLVQSGAEGVGNIFKDGAEDAAEAADNLELENTAANAAYPEQGFPQADSLNTPVQISEGDIDIPMAELGNVDVEGYGDPSISPSGTVVATEMPSRMERFKKYLEDNPIVAKQLQASGTDIAKILTQAAVGNEKRKPVVRATRAPRFQPSKINTPRIGMEDGGSVLGRKMFLSGGEVDGPGGPREDMVPIWASDKEYVMSHNGVKRMGGGDFDKGIAALDKVNKNGVA